MSFLDKLTRTISSGVDRGKFELDKQQKLFRLQSELDELKRESGTKLMELGERALELYRAGQIQSPTIGQIAAGLETIRSKVVLKEEELRQVQNEQFIDSAPAVHHTPPSQSVPISAEPPTPNLAAPTAPAGQKFCGSCGFQMPISAMFCPQCGNRVS